MPKEESSTTSFFGDGTNPTDLVTRTGSSMLTPPVDKAF
jgi:hypothetical protein